MGPRVRANARNRYQRAFLDFFEDEMVRLGYDWKQVVAHYMLEGEHPLITGAIGGGKFCTDEYHAGDGSSCSRSGPSVDTFGRMLLPHLGRYVTP